MFIIVIVFYWGFFIISPLKSSVCSSFLIMIKEMSNFDDEINMNLHEECLLKYLINPLELFYTTELLKSSNELLSKDFCKFNEIAKFEEINYNRI